MLFFKNMSSEALGNRSAEIVRILEALQQLAMARAEVVARFSVIVILRNKMVDPYVYSTVLQDRKTIPVS